MYVFCLENHLLQLQHNITKRNNKFPRRLLGWVRQSGMQLSISQTSLGYKFVWTLDNTYYHVESEKLTHTSHIKLVV